MKITGCYTTPTPTPTATEATTSYPTPPDFSSVFKFNDKVTNLEKDLSKMKQVDQYAQAISLIPAIIDRYLGNKLGEAIHKAIKSHTAECREEALADKKEYIDLIDTSVRAIIKEEVKTQLPQILPQAVSDFATPAASLSEFELMKILMEKMEEHKSNLRADYKKELYDVLVKSYNTDKDLFDTYGEVFTLKITRDDKDKDQEPFTGSDRGMKRRKPSKEAESSRDPRSKESKSLSPSKGTSYSHYKSSGKSAHAEEPSHTVDDSGVRQNQEFNTGNNDEQLDDEPAPKGDWFKKPERPLTPDPNWNKRQHDDFRPPHTWITNTTPAEKSPTSFDELMDTLIDFSAFVLNRLNIINLTQELLVGLAFNLLKGTCKSKPYPFDLRKPLPLILDHQGRQVIPRDYFINNDLKYLKGGSLSRQYSTFVTKTKAASYEVKWIEDMVLNLWSPVKVLYDKHAYWVTILTIRKWRVEDLQLGVESYQKKLNLSKPDTFRLDPRNKTAFTAYSDPEGVIYKDQKNRNILMRTDELHKFSDGTLTSVRTAIHDITLGIRMEYLPKRK
ncbi:hypothetical protein Tco_1023233 [Tanacetum coccineum]